MRKLFLLGPPELRDEEGQINQSFLTGSKRLALLAYLALARPHGYKRRDSLLPLFWPENDQKSARNALSNILYHMRQSLGDDIVVNRGKEEIKLGELWCDTDHFQEAIDNEQYDKAFELYRGPLLKGFHVRGVSSKFEEWLDRERQRLARKYRDLLQTMAEKAEQQGKVNKAVELWRQCQQEAPFESTVTRRLLVALTATGQQSRAMELARAFAEKLQKELGAAADAEFDQLTEGLQQKAAQLKRQSKKRERSGQESPEQKELTTNGDRPIRKAFEHFQKGAKQEQPAESYEQALEEARTARNREPGRALAHATEGIALYHLKRYSEALFAFEEALALANNAEGGQLTKPQAWSVLAMTHAANGNSAETKEILEHVKNTSDWFSVGLILASLGQPGEALAAFKNVTGWNFFSSQCIRYLFPELLDPIRTNDEYDRMLKDGMKAENKRGFLEGEL